MEYIKNFKALVGVVEIYGGAYGREPGLLKAQLIKQGVAISDLDMPDLTIMKKVEEMCRKQYLSCMLLHRKDQSRFFKLKDDLLNDMTKGNNPKMLVETLQLVSNYKVPARAQHVRENGEGVAFIQDGKMTNIKDIDCWHCSKKGHYCRDCPNLRVKGIDDGVQNFIFEECNDGRGLFSANKEEGCILTQAKA